MSTQALTQPEGRLNYNMRHAKHKHVMGCDGSDFFKRNKSRYEIHVNR